MQATTLFQSNAITVTDYRCTAGPDDQPFSEQHAGHSLSYVRKGSFGCRCRGQSHELIAGALLIGHPGDEYTCHHEHHGCGDECLSSFAFAPELVETIGDARDHLAARRRRATRRIDGTRANSRRQAQVPTAISGSMRSVMRLPRVLSTSSRASRAGV